MLGLNIRDALMKQTLVLPSAANTNTSGATGLDTEATSAADFVALTECLVTAPALNTTQLPNAATMTYNLLASANSNMAGAVVLQSAVLTQTGAGGVGAAAATARARIPTNIGITGRFVALQAVGAASNGNCAGSSATLEFLF